MKNILCRTLYIILGLIVLLCSMTGCFKSGSAVETASPEEQQAIAPTGTITVAATAGRAGFMTQQDDGTYIGTENDILNKLKEITGLNAELSLLPTAAEVISGVEDGTYMLGFAGVVSSDETESRVTLSDIYCLSKQVVLMAKDGNISTVKDLKDKNTAVVSFSAGELFCKENSLGYTELDNSYKIISAVAKGASDACITDESIADDLTNGNPDIVKACEARSYGYSACIKKGNEALLKAVNKSIAANQ